MFAACAILGPFALAFFFSPRTVPQNLDFCDTMKAAAHELRHAVVEDPAAAAAALRSLKPLLAQCPDAPAFEPDERDRPIYRGQ